MGGLWSPRLGSSHPPPLPRVCVKKPLHLSETSAQGLLQTCLLVPGVTPGVGGGRLAGETSSSLEASTFLRGDWQRARGGVGCVIGVGWAAPHSCPGLGRSLLGLVPGWAHKPPQVLLRCSGHRVTRSRQVKGQLGTAGGSASRASQRAELLMGRGWWSWAQASMQGGGGGGCGIWGGGHPPPRPHMEPGPSSSAGEGSWHLGRGPPIAPFSRGSRGLLFGPQAPWGWGVKSTSHTGTLRAGGPSGGMLTLLLWLHDGPSSSSGSSQAPFAPHPLPEKVESPVGVSAVGGLGSWLTSKLWCLLR